jgi:hypothetical protein
LVWREVQNGRSATAAERRGGRVMIDTLKLSKRLTAANMPTA